MSDEVTDRPKTETINTSGYWYGLFIPICLGLGGVIFLSRRFTWHDR